MHRRNIDIVIASQSGDLAAILASVAMPEGFTLSLSVTGSLDMKELPVCDLLIHDLGAVIERRKRTAAKAVAP